MVKTQKKENFIWNMIGSLCSSFMSLLLLIIVNGVVGEKDGGIFTFAYSHSQLIYCIGTLEVRPIQSTDVKKKYSFSQYFSLRLLSCIMMIVLGTAYCFIMQCDFYKKSIVFWLTLYKVFEAMEDTFTSMYQQNDRIDYSGKLISFRIILSMITFITVLYGTKQLVWACIGMTICAFLSLITYNIWILGHFEERKIQLQINKKTLEIIVNCIPLFIAVFVMLYISNAPKYAINNYCEDEIQNKYSILFMPAFVISLFSMFVLRPLLTKMATLWNSNELREFIGNIKKMLLLILALSICGIVGAYLVGIPILEFIYHVDLSGMRILLVYVMIYGGLNGINTFLYDMLAVARGQKWLLVAYIVSMIIIIPLAPFLVKNYSLIGAIWASNIAILILDVILSIAMFVIVKRKKKEISGKVESI